MFPKIPRQVFWFASLFATQINLGMLPFFALSHRWTLGGLILALNLFVYSYLGCCFFIGRRVEKLLPRQGITMPERIASFYLLILLGVLMRELVLIETGDSERQIRSAVCMVIGALLMCAGMIVSYPRHPADMHQLSPAFRRGLNFALIVVCLCVLYGNGLWLKTALD